MSAPRRGLRGQGRLAACDAPTDRPIEALRREFEGAARVPADRERALRHMLGDPAALARAALRSTRHRGLRGRRVGAGSRAAADPARKDHRDRGQWPARQKALIRAMSAYAHVLQGVPGPSGLECRTGWAYCRRGAG
jgi:hypothetical protein